MNQNSHSTWINKWGLATMNSDYNIGKLVLLSTLLIFCLTQPFLKFQSFVFQEYALSFELWDRDFFLCLLLWFGFFLLLDSNFNDLFIAGVLVVAVVAYEHSWRHAVDAIVLLFSSTLGKAFKCIFKYKIRMLLIILVSFLSFASCWQWKPVGGFYHGPRWMGLWDNPNTYGILMGVGVVLAAGLLTRSMKIEDRMNNHSTSQVPSPKRVGKESKINNLNSNVKTCFQSTITNWQSIILFIAITVLGVGLVMSYSRGAWLATTIALIYLAWCYNKLKWKYVLFGAGLIAVGALLLWSRTPESAPWYVKRADLGRPSAQHRATAWRAGLEIMRDHPSVWAGTMP